jgi:hypothetical protein
MSYEDHITDTWPFSVIHEHLIFSYIKGQYVRKTYLELYMGDLPFQNYYTSNYFYSGKNQIQIIKFSVIFK